MTHSKALDLGKGPIFPLLMKMSWPSITAMLALAVANLIDAFWLARLSTNALAALTVCLPIQMIFGAIGVGTGIGAGSFAARMFGARQPLKAQQAAGQTVFLSAGLGALSIAVVSIFPDQLLYLFGAHDDIIPLARRYLLVNVWGCPFIYILMIGNNLLRAEGRPNLSMSVILVLAVILIIFDPLLIFGWGPFPRLGIVGAALAAVISYVAAGLLSIYFLRLKTSRYQLHPDHLKPRMAICRAIYQTGFPSVVMNLVVSLVMVAYNHVLAGFGPQAVATLGLCFRMHGLVAMVLFGIGHGVMPLVGFNEGAGQHQRLVETVKVAVRCSALFAGFSSFLMILFAEPILAAFTGDRQLLTIAVPALRIFIMSLVLAGPSLVWINMFIGLGKGVTAMSLMFVRDALLLIPLLLLLPHWLGLTGIWIANPLSNGLAFFIIFAIAAKQIRFYEIKTP